MGSQKAPAAPASPVNTQQIQGAWNSGMDQTQQAAGNQLPMQAYNFYSPQLMSQTPYGYDPQQTVDYGNQWSAQAPGMFQQANQVMETGFDPQSALYNRTRQQVNSGADVALANRGLQMSPYGAGVAASTDSNFNIDWQNQQLQRQATAAQAAAGLYGQGGQAIQGGQQVAAGVPQNMASYAGALQQLGLNAYSPQMWGAQQYGNMFGQGTAAQQGAYKGQLDQFNANSANSNASWGGIGKLVGTLGSAAITASDRRLKTDIYKLGDHPAGWGVYIYKYIGEDQTHVGYMADEVERVRPDAVYTDALTGYKGLNYASLPEVSYGL